MRVFCSLSLTVWTVVFIGLALPVIAVTLVAAIVAIHDFVAHKVPFQALPAGTAEIAWTAFCFAIYLVRTIGTVVLGVTFGG